MKISGLVVLLCLAAAPAAAAERQIDPRALLRLIETGQAPVIVDVRSQAEFEAGHVPGAIHLSFWSIYWNAHRIPASGHDAVVVYCAHGPRAYAAGWQLQLAGIPNIIYLDGQMSGWRKAGLPEESGPESARGRKTHHKSGV